MGIGDNTTVPPGRHPQQFSSVLLMLSMESLPYHGSKDILKQIEEQSRSEQSRRRRRSGGIRSPGFESILKSQIIAIPGERQLPSDITKFTGVFLIDFPVLAQLHGLPSGSVDIRGRSACS